MTNKKLCLLLGVCLLAACTSSAEEVSRYDETAPSNETAEYTCRTINYYDYSNPVPKSVQADEDYIRDMFVAGDSRAGSLYIYTDLRKKGAEMYYTTSITLWGIYNHGPDTGQGSSKPIFDLMNGTDKNNIYLLIGINEIRSSNFEAWGDEYADMIDGLLKKHEDDNIYLILNYQPRRLSNISDEDLRKHINDQNEKIKKAASDRHIYFVDISDELADSSGKIRESLVWDGLHFNSEGAKLFAEYLLTHIVKEDVYVKEVCE